MEKSKFFLIRNTASTGKFKKLDSIQREGIRIYTTLHVEPNNPPLEIRRNELGLRFLYKLKVNTSYIETLNTLDDREDENYEENKKLIKPTEVYL